MSGPCPNCGRINRAGARYCASCQTPLGATSAPLQPGQHLAGGTYRVVRPLGKGGMGAVWLVAQTRAFDRLAVLKEVIEYYDPTDAEARQEALQRFEAEARTLGDLKHPGIPDLYAYFTEGSHNYLVMEYVEGPDLRKGLTREDGDSGQLLPGGPIPAGQVLRHTIEVCKVLEYLAGRQPPVVHNDIKPGNIIIDDHSGRAVLVDFGTAKTRYLRLEEGQGSVYGTVGYAAPELYRGHSEPRSDVYSLAATAYHLLTDDDPRDHPFKYPEIGKLPLELEEILRRALANEADQRPAAGQFRRRLEAHLGGQSASMHALTFPGGDAAGSRAELLSLVATHWRYSAGILQDGTLARWLRGTLHDPAAAQAAEAAAQRWPLDPDAALDAFVGTLDPSALAPGELELRTKSLQLPEVGLGQQVTLEITIANRGSGYLRGEVFGTKSWAKVRSATFACPPGGVLGIPVEIDAKDLAPGQTYLAAVTLAPNGGSPEVVPVQITVTTPAIQIDPMQVDFGTVSRQDLSTPRHTVTVTNAGRAVARCRVLGAPDWLLAKPESFSLQPGGQQSVEFVGRVDKIQGRRHEIPVTIELQGGEDRVLEISLRVKGGLFG